MDEENLNNDEIPENENISDEELDSNIITLKDETGNDINFEFLDLIEYEGENYVVLLPEEDVENEASDEVVILREDKDDEDIDEGLESYVSVDDEDTLNKIFAIFKEKFKDEFNFIDEE